jgi:hypothetical protein
VAGRRSSDTARERGTAPADATGEGATGLLLQLPTDAGASGASPKALNGCASSPIALSPLSEAASLLPPILRRNSKNNLGSSRAGSFLSTAEEPLTGLVSPQSSLGRARGARVAQRTLEPSVKNGVTFLDL